MQTIFSFIFQAFIVIGILSLGFFLFAAVASTTHSLERTIRAIAIATGVFLYGSAKAMGMSLTGWIAAAVVSGTWFSFLAIGAIIPSIAGILVARFVVRTLHSANYMAMRAMIFVGTLILLQFCDLYISTGLQAGLNITKQLAPNLLFLSFFGLYLVFQFKPKGFDSGVTDPE